MNSIMPITRAIVKANKIRPYLVANIVELLDIDVDEKDEESAFKDVSLEVNLNQLELR